MNEHRISSMLRGVALAALALSIRGSHVGVRAEVIEGEGGPTVRAALVDPKPGHPAWIDATVGDGGYRLHVVFEDRPNFVVGGCALDDACSIVRDLVDRRVSDLIDGATRARFEAWFGDAAQTTDTEPVLVEAIKLDRTRDRALQPAATVHSSYLSLPNSIVYANQLAPEFGQFTQLWLVGNSMDPHGGFECSSALDAVHAVAQLHAEAEGLTAES